MGREVKRRRIDHIFTHLNAISDNMAKVSNAKWQELVQYTTNAVYNSRTRPEGLGKLTGDMDEAFYSYFLMGMGEPICDATNHYTAAVGYKNKNFFISYCPTFVGGGLYLLIPATPEEPIYIVNQPRMTLRELTSINLHEVGHIIYNHLARFDINKHNPKKRGWLRKNFKKITKLQRRSNILADVIINGEENNTHLPYLPPGGCFRKRGVEPFSLEDKLLTEEKLSDVCNREQENKKDISFLEYMYGDYETWATAVNQGVDDPYPYTDNRNDIDWFIKGEKPAKLEDIIEATIEPGTREYQELVGVVSNMFLLNSCGVSRNKVGKTAEEAEKYKQALEELWENILPSTKDILTNVSVILTDTKYIDDGTQPDEKNKEDKDDKDEEGKQTSPMLLGLFGSSKTGSSGNNNNQGQGGDGQEDQEGQGGDEQEEGWKTCTTNNKGEIIETQMPVPPDNDDDGGGGGASPFGDAHGAEPCDGDENEMGDAAKNKVENAGQKAGSVPGHIKGMIEKLSKPVYKWKALLSSYIEGTSLGKTRNTYARTNRRYRSSRFMFPGNTLYGGHRMLLMIDDSGSVTNYQLQQCMSELEDMIKYRDCYYLMYDHEVHESIKGVKPPYRYRRGDYKKITMLGRGDTAVANAIQWINEHGAFDWPDVVVILTDGYDGSWPEHSPNPATRFIVGIISDRNDFPPVPDWAIPVNIALPVGDDTT